MMITFAFFIAHQKTKVKTKRLLLALTVFAKNSPRLEPPLLRTPLACGYGVNEFQVLLLLRSVKVATRSVYCSRNRPGQARPDQTQPWLGLTGLADLVIKQATCSSYLVYLADKWSVVEGGGGG